VQPRIIRMMWDVDAEGTEAIMQDMGVSLLAADEQTTGTSSNTASSCCASQPVQSREVSQWFQSLNVRQCTSFISV